MQKNSNANEREGPRIDAKAESELFAVSGEHSCWRLLAAASLGGVLLAAADGTLCEFSAVMQKNSNANEREGPRIDANGN